MRDDIENFFYDKYDYKNEKANKELQPARQAVDRKEMPLSLIFSTIDKTESPINSYTQSLKYLNISKTQYRVFCTGRNSLNQIKTQNRFIKKLSSSPQ